MLKLVIFDMDGTIVDSLPYHKKSWQIFAKKHPIKNFEKLLLQKKGGTITEIMRFMIGKSKSETEIEELGELKESLFRKIYSDKIEPIKGFIDFLKILKKNKISISLASNGGHENIKFVMKKLNCNKYFKFKIGGEDVENGKPNPEMFLRVLELSSLKAKECLIFEDSIEGIKAGVKAGCKVVGVTTSHKPQKLLSLGCNYTIDNYQNINLLNGIINSYE